MGRNVIFGETCSFKAEGAQRLAKYLVSNAEIGDADLKIENVLGVHALDRRAADVLDSFGESAKTFA